MYIAFNNLNIVNWEKFLFVLLMIDTMYGLVMDCSKQTFSFVDTQISLLLFAFLNSF